MDLAAIALAATGDLALSALEAGGCD